MLDGEPDPPIWHSCGLGQGDPLSPQLFVLAVDTLGRLIRRAHDTSILQKLHPRPNIPAISLYADDVMLFYHATPGDVEAIKALKGILALFGSASGLRVNYAKSSTTVLHGDPEATEMIAQVGCPVAELRITYLGVPLTLRRPFAAQLQPFVDSVAARLLAWKAWLMNKAGRLTLVKSVLSTIPVHQMLAFAPPKKTLKQLEKIDPMYPASPSLTPSCHLRYIREVLLSVTRPSSHKEASLTTLPTPAFNHTNRSIYEEATSLPGAP